MFNHQQFSKDLKTQKFNYLNQETVDHALIDQHIKALAVVDLSQLNGTAEKTAFWINVYNGMTNYWVIKKQIKKSMMEQPLLVMFAQLIIGDFKMTLDDIEHGILRSNRRSTYKLWKQFSKRDPRLQLIVPAVDYRIHFALNCGAVSCPAVAFYDAKHLETQLNMAEESFVEQEFLVDHANKTIACSKIFWLYKKDFDQIYINDPQYSQYKIRYRKYDFSVQ